MNGRLVHINAVWHVSVVLLFLLYQFSVIYFYFLIVNARPTGVIVESSVFVILVRLGKNTRLVHTEVAWQIV